jgi:hypothetical protein
MLNHPKYLDLLNQKDNVENQISSFMEVVVSPSTSAGINPNDYLRFETNDVHIVQSVHFFLGSHVSQANRTKIVSGQYIDLTILSENCSS